MFEQHYVYKVVYINKNTKASHNVAATYNKVSYQHITIDNSATTTKQFVIRQKLPDTSSVTKVAYCTSPG